VNAYRDLEHIQACREAFMAGCESGIAAAYDHDMHDCTLQDPHVKEDMIAAFYLWMDARIREDAPKRMIDGPYTMKTRNESIVKERASGASYKAIAGQWGISITRARQIARKAARAVSQ
jgi:hypothetical protein